jgi:hypothetical protein
MKPSPQSGKIINSQLLMHTKANKTKLIGSIETSVSKRMRKKNNLKENQLRKGMIALRKDGGSLTPNQTK